MPDMEISDDVLEFQDVKCGECRVITVQIHNHQHVRCDWFSGQTDEEKKQVKDSARALVQCLLELGMKGMGGKEGYHALI